VNQKREKILDECRAMHNHICIIQNHMIARLIGFHEDESDYYWHIKLPDGKESYQTACGHCVSLKDKDPELHSLLDNTFRLANCQPSEEFHMSKSHDYSWFKRLGLEESA
jgi:hypothetical protein